jgi:hypothetical protein
MMARNLSLISFMILSFVVALATASASDEAKIFVRPSHGLHGVRLYYLYVF